jgi:hypothetical protein
MPTHQQGASKHLRETPRCSPKQRSLFPPHSFSAPPALLRRWPKIGRVTIKGRLSSGGPRPSLKEIPPLDAQPLAIARPPIVRRLTSGRAFCLAAAAPSAANGRHLGICSLRRLLDHDERRYRGSPLVFHLTGGEGSDRRQMSRPAPPSQASDTTNRDGARRRGICPSVSESQT